VNVTLASPATLTVVAPEEVISDTVDVAVEDVMFNVLTSESTVIALLLEVVPFL